jgi:hypothetical protein
MLNSVLEAGRDEQRTGYILGEHEPTRDVSCGTRLNSEWVMVDVPERRTEVLRRLLNQVEQ